MTSDDIPSCACTAHPAGDDRKKYMIVAEETQTFVVWCCKRCSEICHTAVIQVRTLTKGRDQARHKVTEQRKGLDPRLIEMLNHRKRGRANIREREGKKRYA